MTAEPSAIEPPGLWPHVVRLNLSGRTALVTGAGSGIGSGIGIGIGIGRACARRLAAAGANVVVVDRNGEAARVAEATAGIAVTADLADCDAVESLDCDADVVVNSAGIQHVAAIEHSPPERFEHIQRVMLDAPFRLIRRAVPHMYARGWGRIANISSVHGLRASAFKAAYVAAKHGLEGLTKVVVLEAAAQGSRPTA